MKTSKPTGRKLRVENLEDRCLTASLAATPLAPPATSFQTTYEVSGQPPSLTQTPALVRSYELVSGLRMNHNETLVRSRRHGSRRK